MVTVLHSVHVLDRGQYLYYMFIIQKCTNEHGITYLKDELENTRLLVKQ